MRLIAAEARRRELVRRHHLAGDAAGPDAVVRAMIALHATDPASVYLSVLARSATASLADVADAMYARRSLVRWMAMRRTLFVFAREDVPGIQAAVSTPLAAALHRQLVARLRRRGSDPPIEADVETWLADLAGRVEATLAVHGSATGAQLAGAEPGLRTRIPPGTASERPQNLTTTLLTLMSAEGRLVRATPTGAWTSRQHRWEPVSSWWPDGMPSVEPDVARRELAHRWLIRFGPATIEDLRWWTGWNLTTTRRTLAGLAFEEVDLDGEIGIRVPDDRLDEAAPSAPDPVAALLPALDPTPMGYARREWFLGVDRDLVFDRAGNIGPTVWCDGEIIGAWAVGPQGDVRTRVIADRGGDAALAVERAAERLQARLDGTVVTPAFHTPLERELAR